LGLFAEFGNGSYDTFNSFADASEIWGSGQTYHVGGGILGRLDFNQTGPGHFYAEASGRLGKLHNEHESSDLGAISGAPAAFDSSSVYYGFHAGLGYLWELSPKVDLDLSGKVFWTRLAGDTVSLSAAEQLSFADSDSLRLRLGTRLSYEVSPNVRPFFGLAYEHEGDGKARAATNGLPIDAPSLKGGTGMAELGLSLTPSGDQPFRFDLGIQGYAGKRQGVTGTASVMFSF
jgi:outer membrane autotransporter protein